MKEAMIKRDLTLDELGQVIGGSDTISEETQTSTEVKPKLMQPAFSMVPWSTVICSLCSAFMPAT